MAENPPGFGQPDDVPTEPSPPGGQAPGGQAPGDRAPGDRSPGGENRGGAQDPAEARTEPPGGYPAVGTPSSPETGGSLDAGPRTDPSRADEGRRDRRDARARRSQAVDDAAFLELVSRFDQEPGPDGRGWPAAEDVDEPRRPSIVVIRPAGRRPDGMPPDGRHLADDDPAERTAPPAGTGSPAADGDDPTGGVWSNRDPARSDPAGTDRTGAGEPGGGRAGERRAGGGLAGGGRPGVDGIDEAVRAAYAAGDPDLAPEEDDHYLPPPPPPVPKMRPVTRWALGSIALGVAILVVPALIGLNQSRSQDVAGVLLILGGVGTLVARMGERPPTDFDGPDDGAVV